MENVKIDVNSLRNSFNGVTVRFRAERKSYPVVGDGSSISPLSRAEVYATPRRSLGFRVPCNTFSLASRNSALHRATTTTCSALHRRVRCKSVTSSGVRVATGHQIPCEWTYITLGCFLRTLTMTDRPRKDTDLSLFVGPYQPRSSCIPFPPSRSGHRILS